MPETDTSKTDSWQQWTKQPGDEGWLRVAVSRRILPWTIGLAILVVLAAPVLIVLFESDVPTRVRLGTGVLYVVGLFTVAAASDRAVQLERRRRRESRD
jgi:hypothetical protein